MIKERFLGRINPEEIERPLLYFPLDYHRALRALKNNPDRSISMQSVYSYISHETLQAVKKCGYLVIYDIDETLIRTGDIQANEMPDIFPYSGGMRFYDTVILEKTPDAVHQIIDQTCRHGVTFSIRKELKLSKVKRQGNYILLTAGNKMGAQIKKAMATGLLEGMDSSMIIVGDPGQKSTVLKEFLFHLRHRIGVPFNTHWVDDRHKPMNGKPAVAPNDFEEVVGCITGGVLKKIFPAMNSKGQGVALEQVL